MELTGLELLAGFDGGTVLEDVDQGEVLVGVVAGLVVEGENDRTEQSILELGQLLLGHPERLGHLVVVRHPAELGGELLLGGLEAAGQQTDRAGRPVGGPNRVEDGASDALGGEPFERHPPAVVVAASGLDQAESAGSGQLLPVDVAGEMHRHLEHHMLHQWQVGFDPRVELGVVLHVRCALHRFLHAEEVFDRSQNELEKKFWDFPAVD
ncbi:MAG: hypothetical protein AAF962_06525 [Actinomycetota bacterium]